jgi:hypothetical protein
VIITIGLIRTKGELMSELAGGSIEFQRLKFLLTLEVTLKEPGMVMVGEEDREKLLIHFEPMGNGSADFVQAMVMNLSGKRLRLLFEWWADGAEKKERDIAPKDCLKVVLPCLGMVRLSWKPI